MKLTILEAQLKRARTVCDAVNIAPETVDVTYKGEDMFVRSNCKRLNLKMDRLSDDVEDATDPAPRNVEVPADEQQTIDSRELLANNVGPETGGMDEATAYAMRNPTDNDDGNDDGGE